MAKEILCYAPCKVCGARCAHKVDAGGHVFYRCDGNADSKACAASVRFGRTHSENMIRDAAKAAEGNDDDKEKASRSDDDKREAAPVADTGEPKRKRGSFLGIR